VTVAGTVIGRGGTAVGLSPGAANRLILQPGAMFQGLIDGGAGGSSMLEIAGPAGGSGAIGGGDTAGSSIVDLDLHDVRDFSTLQVDSGETLVASNSGLVGNVPVFTTAGIGSPGVNTAAIADLNAQTLDATEIDFANSAGEILLAGGGVTSSALRFYQAAGDLLSGSGIVNLGGHISGAGTVNAAGGQLAVAGTIDSGVGLAVTGGTLQIQGIASAAAAIAFNVANSGTAGGAATPGDTLDLYGNGALAIAVGQTVGASDVVQFDGGTLSDVAGLTLAAGATVSGFGTLASAVTATGAATIVASGGTLEVTGTVTDAGGALGLAMAMPFDRLRLDAGGTAQSVAFGGIDTVLELGIGAALTVAAPLAAGNGTLQLDAASHLRLDAAFGTGNTVSFAAAGGTLALADDTGFAGMIAGMTVGGGITGDVVDIIGTAVSVATVGGQGSDGGTLTLSDGAVLNLSNIAATAWMPVTAPDGSGGTLLFLAAPHPASDFNADGFSDVLWQNPSGGGTQTWVSEMNGAQVLGGSNAGPGGPAGWTIAGSGDFDADGTADVLWQDASAGGTQTWISEMNGPTALPGSTSGPSGPAGWTVAGIGDFDGDGHADILWQDASASGTQTWISEMNGTAVLPGSNSGPGGPAGWTVAGIGDFDGDGHADILWQDNSGGITQTWISEMNGTTVLPGSNSGPGGPAGWTVAGVGDFNGDGKADILWQDASASGTQTWVSEMNGTQVLPGSGPGPSGPAGWTVAPLTGAAASGTAFAFADLSDGSAPGAGGATWASASVALPSSGASLIPVPGESPPALPLLTRSG
jgi:hypothetical protein